MNLKLLDVRREPRERLPSTPADAHEQRVPAGLRNDAADAAHVLERVEEQHQVHGLLTRRVEVHEVLGDHAVQLIVLEHLAVHLGVRAGDQEIAKHQTSELRRVHHPVAVGVQSRENFVEGNIEVLLCEPLGHLEEPLAVGFVREPVREHPQALVHPQPGQRTFIGDALFGGGADTLEHLGNVAEVKGVMRLHRRGQQLALHRLVQLDGPLDQARLALVQLLGQAFGSHPPLDQGAENLG